jgi:hypothetical protein
MGTKLVFKSQKIFFIGNNLLQKCFKQKECQNVLNSCCRHVLFFWGINELFHLMKLMNSLQGILSIPTHVFVTCVQINHFCNY